jgi:hypothetical protein
MSALGAPILINPDRAYWLSSIGNDVIHSTIVVDTIDANVANISTLNGEFINASTLNVSTLGAKSFDVSGMYVSSIRGNTAFFSSMSLASDLSGGVGFVRFSVDASGIQVDGDPIRFDNLVYLTSTINIVQVSTLIDTDIFASNGYFSTLSTGSLSSGVASIRQANISSLYVSSLEGFDISGADPTEWSLYPTLNSSIIFQPGNVLSNVGNKLYFAGQEITDLSGGGVNWSLFPAISTVNMSNNRLINLSTILFQDGGTLTSLTGNNLQYNGQPIQVGNASNITQWASYPAVSSVNMNSKNLSNVVGISGSNLALSGSNITNGNTFTNSLGVGGTSLISLATIDSGGDLTCRNITVGDTTTSLADVNIYGATALPGDSALYVAGGVQFDGGTIHGFSAGLLPVGGINTGRIDMLQGGFNILHPLVGAITTGTALSITAGGAMSLAGGAYIEMNTSTLQMINTSQGNKNTTVQAGFLTIDPDVAPTSSIKLFNTLGGGVEIDGGGQGSLTGFSTVRGLNLSTLNLQVSTINGFNLSTIVTPSIIDCSAVNITGNLSVAQSSIMTNLTVNNRSAHNNLLWNFALGLSTVLGNLSVNSINIADNITGVTNIPPIQARIELFSSIQSGTMSTINLVCSTINGQPPGSGGGGGNVFSTLQVSTLSGVGIAGGVGSTIAVDTGLQFIGTGQFANSGHFISSLRIINDIGEPFLTQASTITLSYTGGINPNGFIRIGDGGAFDAYFVANRLSTNVTAINSSITNELNVSTIGKPGTELIGFNNGIRFTTLNGLDNVGAINLNPSAVPVLNIGASTISLNANWTRINGFLSTTIVSSASVQCQNVSTNVMNAPFISSLVANISTIQYADKNTTPTTPSSLMNFAFLYDLSGFPFSRGVTLENYVNQVDNFDIQLLGNGDGSHLYSYGDNRSTFTNMVITANYVDLSVSDGITISDNNTNNFTEIQPTYISTAQAIISSINDVDARVAYTNNLMLSSMELYAGSTTLMYWSTVTTSSNINTSGYDVVAGLNGAFKIGASFQFISGGATDEVEFFLLKNGSVISQSGGIIELENNQELVTYVESIESLANGDTIQIGCYTANTNVFVSTINGNVIQSPAVILTMYKVG